MGKNLRHVLSLCALLFLLGGTGAVLSGCTFTQGNPVQSAEKNIVSISVDETTLPDVIYVGEFDEAGIQLLVTYSDGTSESVALKKTFIPSAYQHYLETPGEWNVTIYYRGSTTTIKLKIADRYFTVDFYAMVNTNTLEKISSQSVKKGEAAVSPEGFAAQLPYEHALYTFKSWDVDFSSVVSDLKVSATYSQETIYWVSFFRGDNTLIQKNYVKEGADAVAPRQEEAAMAGYTFLGWDRAFSAVISDLEVYGLYIKAQGSSTTAVWDGTTIAASFGGGSGSESDPYLIADPTQLAYLASTSDTLNYAGIYFKQTADLDLGSQEWKPIGYCLLSTWTAMGFQGHYDGDNHQINHLKIANVRSDGYGGNYYLGLFGWIRRGSVANLTLNNFDLSITTTVPLCTSSLQSDPQVCYGVLCGETRSGSVTNCTLGSGTMLYNGTAITNGLVGRYLDVD